MRSLAPILWLLGAELRLQLRDRLAFGAMVVTALGAGFAPHGLELWRGEGRATIEPAEPYDADPRSCEPPCAAELFDTVRFEGERPDWLWWPEEAATAREAEAVVVVLPPNRLEVLPMGPDADAAGIAQCLRRQSEVARTAALREAGIDEVTVPVLRIDRERLERLPWERLPAMSGAGAALAVTLVLLILSVLADAGPTARASGTLESYLALPLRRRDIVVAWWLVGCVVGAGGALLAGIGHVVGAALTGDLGLGFPIAAAPMAVALASSCFVFVFVDAVDLRAVLARSIPLLLAVPATVAVSSAVGGWSPALAVFVPGGGLVSVLLGWTEGLSTWLALVSSAGYTVLFLAASVRALRQVEVGLGVMGRAAARRASGNYRPEAALLFFIAMAGTVAWIPRPLQTWSAPLATVLAQGLFLLLPALVVARPLRLDAAALLSWRRPTARAVAMAPLVAAGALAIGAGLALATRRWFDESLVREFMETLQRAGGAGLHGLVLLALVPAVCEELLFRGAILSLLRKSMPVWVAILVQALLFGALHGLAFRILPTAALGVILGVLVARTRSVVPAMIVHALNNGAALAMAEQGADAPAEVPLETWAALAAVAALGLTALVLSGGARRAPSQ